MLRLALAGLLALVCSPVYAVDLAGIEASTTILYENGEPVCSASVVHSEEDATILLTANHCLSGGGEFSIQTTERDAERKVLSYTVFLVDVLKKDPKSDLAVLRLRDKSVRMTITDIATVEEADAALFKGAEILAAGYPNSHYAPMEDLVYTAGLFTGLRDSFVPSITVPVYRTTTPLWYGKSGGALYTLIGVEWKLVGVASQLNPETPWETSLFIPAKEIQKILKGAWIGTVAPVDPNVVRDTLRDK